MIIITGHYFKYIHRAVLSVPPEKHNELTVEHKTAKDWLGGLATYLPGSKPGAKAAPAPARVRAGGAVALWCPLLGSGSTPPSAAPPGFAKNSAHARLPHLLLAIRRVK